jgi:hypothetical protein
MAATATINLPTRFQGHSAIVHVPRDASACSDSQPETSFLGRKNKIEGEEIFMSRVQLHDCVDLAKPNHIPHEGELPGSRGFL